MYVQGTITTSDDIVIVKLDLTLTAVITEAQKDNTGIACEVLSLALVISKQTRNFYNVVANPQQSTTLSGNIDEGMK